jgi:hypothetical protein
MPTLDGGGDTASVLLQLLISAFEKSRREPLQSHEASVLCSVAISAAPIFSSCYFRAASSLGECLSAAYNAAIGQLESKSIHSERHIKTAQLIDRRDLP